MPDMEKAIIILLIVAAVAGWAFIELVLWLLSFVDISWSGSQPGGGHE